MTDDLLMVLTWLSQGPFPWRTEKKVPFCQYQNQSYGGKDSRCFYNFSIGVHIHQRSILFFDWRDIISRNLIKCFWNRCTETVLCIQMHSNITTRLRWEISFSFLQLYNRLQMEKICHLVVPVETVLHLDEQMNNFLKNHT